MEQEVHIHDWLPPGLRVVRKVDGGTDSLFESLQEVMSETLGLNNNFSTDELRRRLVDELLENPTMYRVKLDKQLRKSLKVMRNPGCMPTLDVLQVFAVKCNCQLWMHIESDKPIIFDGGIGAALSDLVRVHIQLLGGVHFNPVWETPNKYEMSDMEVDKQEWRHTIDII